MIIEIIAQKNICFSLQEKKEPESYTGELPEDAISQDNIYGF